MLLKCCTQHVSKFEKLGSGPRTGKDQFSFNPKEGQAKEGSDYCTDALISHANKVLLKILQGRLHQYMSRELPDVQAAFRKGRGTSDLIANIHWVIDHWTIENSRKASTSALLTMLKPLTVWITTNCGKFL